VKKTTHLGVVGVVNRYISQRKIGANIGIEKLLR
jgi:hypothetical protein